MGADIYLKSVFEPNNAKHKEAFDTAVAARDALPHGSAEAKEAQKAVAKAYNAMYAVGYFRDPYNGSGLFAQTDLSWWRDVVPMLTKKGTLPIRKARVLLARVKAAEFAFDPELLWFYVIEGKNSWACPDMDERKKIPDKVKEAFKQGLSPEATARYAKLQARYEDDRKALCDLLQQSIDLNEPLEMSL